jgi:CheY-like chemotaxis protein
MKDHYAILEVPPTASHEAIREQYLLLIQAWHPDKFSKASQKAKAEEKCKEINAAYEVLKDAKTRAKYDRELRGESWQPSEEKRRKQSQEPRQRKQDEDVERQKAEETRRQQSQQERRRQPGTAGQRTHFERNQREASETELRRAEHERQVQAAQEWIRVFFEQAVRRKSEQPPSGAKGVIQEPIHVLVVDDAAETRAHICGLLASESDIKVVGEASDGREAIRQFEALMPDVTTVCINMSSMDGIAATEAICRKHPSAKVIVISDQVATNDIRRAAMSGACDYLVKPPQQDELHLAVRLAAGR